MGELSVNSANDSNLRSHFIRHLLDDVKSLEIMLEKGMIEKGVGKIGAEQEFCLISDTWRPQNTAEEILTELNDSHFTNELAKFNLEVNLDPVALGKTCLDEIEAQLREEYTALQRIAKKHNTLILLTGILPTISKTELSLDYITPKPRYLALNEAVRNFRGADFHLHIKGVDELSIRHDSVIMEACNTSWQLHLQVDPDNFTESYNWAQAISGPVLGICANSPLLLGRELWHETRIALFQQSIDTRHASLALKDQVSRVSFGEQWETGSIADIYKHDIASHKILIAKAIEKSSLAELEAGRIPKLEALNTHNGTVYRWNRPCYGKNGDTAHVRIENRYIPSGPTITDQMANFAFWIGLMKGKSIGYENISSHMDFADAKANFVRAARTGKQSILIWKDRMISVRDLITRELLPMAYSGLEKAGVDKATANRLLEVIDQRAVERTGAQWSISNYRRLKKTLRNDDALLALTKHMYENQQSDRPVHEWKDVPDQPNTHENATSVGHIMSTKLFTVQSDDLAELATQLMIWKNIHHLPVECNNGQICGILTWTHLERFKAAIAKNPEITVREIMNEDVILTHTEMSIEEAIQMMKHHEIGCLPVVHNQHLVGIVTITDMLEYDKKYGS